LIQGAGLSGTGLAPETSGCVKTFCKFQKWQENKKNSTKITTKSRISPEIKGKVGEKNLFSHFSDFSHSLTLAEMAR